MFLSKVQYFKNNLLNATIKLGYRHLSNNSDGFKQIKQPVVDIKHYKILDLNPDEAITDDILQKAVSKRLHQVHPDKGGSNKDTMSVLVARGEFRRFLLNSSSDNSFRYSASASNGFYRSNNSRYNGFNSSSSNHFNGYNRANSSDTPPWYISFLMTIMCFSPAVMFGLLADFTHKKEFEPRDRENNSRYAFR